MVTASPAATAPATATTAPGGACRPVAAPAATDWNGRVWYEAFVRSFADGDGDGIGDLRGLTARLDHLNDGDPTTTADLGVTGIWLMPIAESPSYHGYDVVDYRAVERDYGTRADVEAFLDAAHRRGIRVIVDLVLEPQLGREPVVPRRRDARLAARPVVRLVGHPADVARPDGQTVWHPAGTRWYYGVFSPDMPDLNLRNPGVTRELEDVARFWLEDVGVDGFRLDAAKHLIEDGEDRQTNTPETRAWLAGFKASVDAVRPDALLVGEVWDPASIAGAYVPGSVDGTFDFGLATATRLALQNGRAAPLMTGLTDTLAAWPANQNASFLTNHDQPRIMSELGGDVPSAKLAAFMLLTEPGTPFLYYGEEIGMTGTKPDERIRTPMRWTTDPATAGFTTGTPWEPLSDDPPTVSVEAQTGDPGSLLTTYRDLVRLRGQQPALQRGATVVVDGGAEPVIGWLRTTGEEALLVVVNVSDAPVTDYRLTLDGGPLCGPMAARLLGTVGGDPAATPASPAVTPGRRPRRLRAAPRARPAERVPARARARPVTGRETRRAIEAREPRTTRSSPRRAVGPSASGRRGRWAWSSRRRS